MLALSAAVVTAAEPQHVRARLVTDAGTLEPGATVSATESVSISKSSAPFVRMGLSRRRMLCPRFSIVKVTGLPASPACTFPKS